MAVGIAVIAARSGAAVQVVGRVGEDSAGDEVLLALAAGGVGHVAVLREATHSTPVIAPDPGEPAGPDGSRSRRGPPRRGSRPRLHERSGTGGDAERAETPGLSMDAGDVELALRYLPDYRVLILADDLEPAALAADVAAAGWSGAHLVTLVGTGGSFPGSPADAAVLERPAADPDGDFARIVAASIVMMEAKIRPKSAIAMNGIMRIGMTKANSTRD